MTQTPDPPETLKQAEAVFSRFLVANGYPPNVRWITKEQLVIQNDPPSHLVEASGADIGKAEANRRYESGLQKGFGILLQVICATPDNTVANVVIPEDSRDADNRRIYGTLKCSCPTTRVDTKLIENDPEWNALAETFQLRTPLLTMAFDL